MKTRGNTILITGGGSGIGRGLAESFHKQGNQVVITGRRQQVLDEVTAANPGMKSLLLDINDRDSIHSFSEQVAQDYLELNVLINNAGIMKAEDLKSPPNYLEDAEAIVTTNLLGPIRLTAALLPLLQNQPYSAVLTVSSGLAFVPRAEFPSYGYTPAEKSAFEAQMKERDVPEIMVQRVVGFLTDIKNGQEEEVSPDLENLLGRKPASLKESLKVLFKL